MKDNSQTINNEKLRKTGYTTQQINQISSCPDLCTLKPYISINIFRFLKRLLNNDNYIDKYNLKFAFDYFNETNDTTVCNYLDNVESDETVHKFLEIYCDLDKKEELTFDEILNFANKDLDTESLELLLKIHIMSNKQDVSSIEDYDIETLGCILDSLNNNSTLKLNNFIAKDAAEISLLYDLSFDKEIDFSLLGEINIDKLKLLKPMMLLKLDYSILKNTSNEQIKELLEMSSYYKDEFIKIYNKNYSPSQLKIIMECVNINKPYDFFINNTKYEEAKLLKSIKLYREGATEEQIKTFLDNYDKYDQNDIYEIFTYADYLNYNIYYSNPEWDTVFDLSYDTNQRKTIIEGLKENFNVTKYCTPDYMPSQMRVIIDARKHHKPFNKILDPTLTPSQMEKILFYESQNIEFKTIEEYEQNYDKDVNDFYENFVNTFYRTFTDSHDAFFRMPLLNEILSYNEKSEYKHNIEKTLEMAKFFNENNIDEFYELLKLNDKAENLYEITNSSEFFKKLHELFEKNDVEIDARYQQFHENKYYDIHNELANYKIRNEWTDR